MFWISNKWLPIFLILAACQGTHGSKPEILPGDTEIYINEGESLELKCTSEESIEFSYPMNASYVNTSAVFIEAANSGNKRAMILRRPNAIYGDTGWYGCANTGGIFTPGYFDDPYVSWTYVYVKSNSSYFVEYVDERPYRVFLGRSITIPCRPTSPDYNINFTVDGMEIEMGSRASYDPKDGLILKNATMEDNGTIVCSITDGNTTQEFNYHLRVIDPDVKYINLMSNGSDEVFERKVGDHVSWVVNVDAYPHPVLKWLNHEGYVIRGSWIDLNNSKYVIEYSPYSARMRINKLEISDSGDYTLRASNGDQTETLKFTLVVFAKPTLKLQHLAPFYMVHREVKISGEVRALPLSNITCTFLEAPNYPYLVDTRLVSLEVNDNFRNPVSTMGDMPFRSIIQASRMFSIGVITFFTKFNSTASGLLNCTACNTLGCDSKVDLIYVSDLPLGSDFVAFGPRIRLMVGDDINITCAISIYTYVSVEWLDEKDEPFEESQQFTITRDMTRFSNRTHLHIKNVEKEKNGTNYACRALTRNGELKVTEYKLLIYDPEKPYIWATNMKGIPIILDLSSDKNVTVFFSCYARGPPLPTITWYKDNTKIECNKHYTCLEGNQEFHIKKLNNYDAGNYTCEAENRVGKEYKFQIVQIKGKDTPKALIISIVVLVIICVTFVIFFSIKIHRENAIRKELMEAGLTHFMDGALESLNPKLTVEEQAELLPYQQKWEFPRERLDIGKQLGSGAFGVVVKAKAWGITDHESVTTVAVKKVKNRTESTCIRTLASELKIMVHLGKHLNIVNLLGACTKNIPKCELLVIVEYCSFGNLQMYLLKHRANFINQIDPTSGKLDTKIGIDKLITKTTTDTYSTTMKSCASIPGAETVTDSDGFNYQSYNILPDGYITTNSATQPGLQSCNNADKKTQNFKPICTQDLVSWGFQVARGMEYLSQRRVLHGDLAARNILLANDNVVKICDFGLAKTLYKDVNYKKKADALLPVRWMAIESIRDRIFSTQSDVWSFGIVLWEFFSLAETPYPGMQVEKQYLKLLQGYRMEKPKYASEAVYKIMLQCWNEDPTLRPTFTNLITNIGDLLEESVKDHYVDLNAPYLDLNRKVLENEKNDYLILMSAPDYNVICSPTNQYVKSSNRSSSDDQKNDSLPISNLSPGSESGISSAEVISSDDSKFSFPINEIKKKNLNADSESEAVKMSLMSTQAQDTKIYSEMDKENESDCGYCGTPINLDSVDLERD